MKEKHCEICGQIDRGGVAHQFCRALHKFRADHPGYVPLNERSSIGTALERRGYKVLRGPGTYVSSIGCAFMTECAWVYAPTLREWEAKNIK